MSAPSPETVLSSRHTLLKLHPNGQRAVTLTHSDCLVVWTLCDQTATVESVHPLGAPITDLSVSGDGDTIAVAFRGGLPRLYDWSFSEGRKVKLAADLEISRVAFSPCDRFLALATDHQSVLLYEPKNSNFSTELEGGERTLCIGFSKDGKWFTWAMSSQSGASVAVARVEDDDLKPARGMELAALDTSPEEFVDTVPAVAFSSDGSKVAVFQTSGIYHDRKPPGWRGDVILTELQSRRIMGGLNLQPDWQLSVDARVTQDPTADSGAEISAPAQLVFCADDEQLALGLSDRLILLAAKTGEPTSQFATPALGLAPGRSGLWVAGIGLSHHPLS